MPPDADRHRLQRHWDRSARSYDKQIGFFDRRLFRDNREWICRQTRGEVLEVGIGTGLNLDWYPPDVTLTGVDLSPGMLAHARRRADALGRPVTLSVGDAEHLDAPDASFDTAVCTYSLCAVPDERRAVTELVRVLRPGGRLLLADHVVSTAWPVRVLQRALELATVPIGEEHFRRRPIQHVRAAGLTIEAHDRFALGIVERLAARKP